MSATARELCRRARTRGFAADWRAAPGLGALLVTGPDAGPFLQTQLTNDVLALAPGQGQLSARLDSKGNLVAWFSLHRWPDQGQPLPTYLLVLPRDEVATLRDDLARHVVSEDVLLEDAGDEFDGTVRQGPDVAALVGTTPEHAMLAVDGGWNVVRSFTGDPGLLRLVPAGVAPAPPAASDGLEWWADTPDAALAWRWLTLEAGAPRLGHDLPPGRRALPQTGLEARVVSATKGCYLGQEVVARIRTYGSVPVALRGLVFDAPPAADEPPWPAPGSDLLADDGRRLGAWAGGAWSAVWEAPVALAFLDREHRAPGTRLALRLGDDAVDAEVRLLPLYQAADGAARARHLHERAVQRFSRGRDDEAVALLEEALRLDPGHAETYEALGVILGRRERYHEAIDIFRRLEELAPQEPMVHTNLSLFYMRLGDTEEAERQKAQATLKRFANLDDAAQARDREAEAAAARRADAERKAAMFREVLDIDPDDPLALMGLGNALLALDRLAEAEPVLARARAGQPDNSPLYVAHGKALEHLARPAEAAAVYREGLQVASRKGDLMPLRELEHRLLMLTAQRDRD